MMHGGERGSEGDLRTPCSYGHEADPGGLKKAMWLEIFIEFPCEALSTWLSCDDRRQRRHAQSVWKETGNFAAELPFWVQAVVDGEIPTKLWLADRLKNIGAHGACLEQEWLSAFGLTNRKVETPKGSIFRHENQ